MIRPSCAAQEQGRRRVEATAPKPHRTDESGRGDAAAVVERALSMRGGPAPGNVRGDRPRCASPGFGSRHVPAPVVREVWRRDAAGCAFVGPEGRCRETARLELHHVVPFGAGGWHEVSNLQLRCRAHNQYEAAAHYGIEAMQRARQERNEARTRSGPS